MRRILILGIAAVALAACSSDNPKPQIGPTIGALLKRTMGTAQQPPSDPLAGLTRAVLADIDGPLYVANLEETGAFSTLSRIAGNRGADTFTTPDNVTLVLRSGVVQETRGLSGDIMSSDVSGITAALARPASGSHRRRFTWLDGEEHPIRASYDCTLTFVDDAEVELVEVTHRTKHWREACSGPAGGFVNDYWIDRSDRTIWYSRQWLGDALGYITFSLLIE
jgi:hypothetical protein